MYLDYFGMRERPFPQTPNPDFYVYLEAHHRCLISIRTALDGGKALVCLTGEPGSGKSLLCLKLLGYLPEQYFTVYIANPLMNPVDLLQDLARKLGISPAIGANPFTVLLMIEQQLADFRSQGRQTVLIVDEAQAMPDGGFDILKQLLDMRQHGEKLLQVVLSGQPELNDLIMQPHLRQIRKRISSSSQMQLLGKKEISLYIRQRCRLSGADDKLFTEEAISLITRSVQGRPALINRVCEAALENARSLNERRISRRHVVAALNESGLPLHSPFYLDRARRQELTTAGFVAVILTLIFLYFVQ